MCRKRLLLHKTLCSQSGFLPTPFLSPNIHLISGYQKNTIAGAFLSFYIYYFSQIFLLLQIKLRIDHLFITKFRLPRLYTGCMVY